MNDNELVATIEKMLGDTVKGLATKTELKEQLDVKIAEHTEQKLAEAQKAIDETQAKIKEFEELNTSLTKQIKSLLRTNFARIKTPDNMYNGFWGDLETAKTAGMVIMASVYKSEKAKSWLDDRGITLEKFTEDKEKAQEGSETAGAILVPTELIANLILLIEKYGVFRRNALEWPMSSDSGVAPKLSAGLTVFCPGGGVAPSASSPTFQGVGLNAKKWITLTALDSELTEDAVIAIGEVVGFLIGQAFAQKEDEVGFLGDGTSTYFGHTGIGPAILAVDDTPANIKSLVIGSGNAWTNLTLADFEKNLGTIPDYADNGDLKWYAHRMFYYTVMVKLALAAGGVSSLEILQGKVTGQRNFLYYPVELTQAMPKATAADQIATIFGNLRLGAYLGDRRKLTIDRSSERYFDADQVAIRGTERVAPAIHGVGDTTNAGPITALRTAS